MKRNQATWKPKQSTDVVMSIKGILPEFYESTYLIILGITYFELKIMASPSIGDTIILKN